VIETNIIALKHLNSSSTRLVEETIVLEMMCGFAAVPLLYGHKNNSGWHSQ
jgi:hypothetical protein